MKASASKGLTLIEILVVLIVIGVIAAIAAPSFSDMLLRRRVQAVAQEISTDLALLRQESQMRPNDVIIQFEQDANQSCYVLYQSLPGGGCGCVTAPNPPSPAVCLTNIEMKTVRIPRSTRILVSAASPDFVASPMVPYPLLVFRPPRLTANLKQFVVTVTGVNGRGVAVATMNVGMVDPGDVSRIKVCTPDSSVPGAQPC